MAWYKAFRAATYAGLLGALVWTVLLVLPFRPFSYLLPIVEHEGPGIWFLLSYLLFLIVALAGFGVLSSLLYTIEVQENRKPNQLAMLSGFVLLVIGVFAKLFSSRSRRCAWGVRGVSKQRDAVCYPGHSLGVRLPHYNYGFVDGSWCCANLCRDGRC